MSSDDVIKVIDTICDKIGIAFDSAKEFVPSLAKYEIVSNAFYSIMSAVIIAISIIAIKKAFESAENEIKKEIEDGVSSWNRHEDVWDFWRTWIATLIGVLLLVIFTISFVSSVHDVLTWIVSPDVSAINYVMDMVQ